MVLSTYYDPSIRIGKNNRTKSVVHKVGKEINTLEYEWKNGCKENFEHLFQKIKHYSRLCRQMNVTKRKKEDFSSKL